jgi:hypothetical protein
MGNNAAARLDETSRLGSPVKVQRPGKIDPDLEATDRLLDIWSMDRYEGGERRGLHPLEVMRLLHDDELPGEKISNDEVMIIVDQAVLRAPRRVRATVEAWYRGSGPAEVKAKRLGISRAALYSEWKMSVAYMRATFRSKGLAV